MPEPRNAEASPPRYVCSSTGLSLSPGSSQVVYRVAKPSYGALNPFVPKVGTPKGDWGRFDVADHRTIYAAYPEEASYAEALAPFRPADFLKHGEIGEFFEVSNGKGRPLWDRVTDEWAELQHMPPGKLAQGWRLERLVYEVTLPPHGFFIRLDTSSSLAVVDSALRKPLKDLGVNRLTTSHISGDNRELTTLIASWVRDQVLEDGSLPHGIEYGSKHGNNWICWAVWLRRADDELPGELTTADQGTEIREPDQNPSLASIAERFDIRLF